MKIVFYRAVECVISVDGFPVADSNEYETDEEAWKDALAKLPPDLWQEALEAYGKVLDAARADETGSVPAE